MPLMFLTWGFYFMLPDRASAMAHRALGAELVSSPACNAFLQPRFHVFSKDRRRSFEPSMECGECSTFEISRTTLRSPPRVKDSA